MANGSNISSGLLISKNRKIGFSDGLEKIKSGSVKAVKKGIKAPILNSSENDVKIVKLKQVKSIFLRLGKFFHICFIM